MVVKSKVTLQVRTWSTQQNIHNISKFRVRFLHIISNIYRFLFHKESAAYRQYEQLVEQFKMELGKSDESKKEENFYKPEDTYEPESMDDEDPDKRRDKQSEDHEKNFKRKRKSRWGDKDTSIPPPVLITNTPSTTSTNLPSNPAGIT